MRETTTARVAVVLPEPSRDGSQRPGGSLQVTVGDLVAHVSLDELVACIADAVAGREVDGRGMTQGDALGCDDAALQAADLVVS